MTTYSPFITFPFVFTLFTFPPQHGDTALIEAAKCGHLEVVRLLLDRGANIEHKNRVRKCGVVRCGVVWCGVVCCGVMCGVMFRYNTLYHYN